jgi:2-C-methyl-D-erythritol 2,4-cyclodiphosphate synthase
MTHRVGIGYDIHRLEPGRGIVVGGVQIPCEYHAVAHSDGDVVLHALCDALLGAVGAGDLGEHFPDTDEAHRGRDSRTFVYDVLQLPALKPWRLTNMDCNIIAQAPRMGPYKLQMRQVLAEMLCVPLGRVGVKARTNEGLDAVGEKKAIQAQVVVLLEPIR